MLPFRSTVAWSWPLPSSCVHVQHVSNNARLQSQPKHVFVTRIQIQDISIKDKHTHTHTHIYIYIYTCMWNMYVCVCMHTWAIFWQGIKFTQDMNISSDPTDPLQRSSKQVRVHLCCMYIGDADTSSNIIFVFQFIMHTKCLANRTLMCVYCTYVCVCVIQHMFHKNRPPLSQEDDDACVYICGAFSLCEKYIPAFWVCLFTLKRIILRAEFLVWSPFLYAYTYIEKSDYTHKNTFTCIFTYIHTHAGSRAVVLTCRGQEEWPVLYVSRFLVYIPASTSKVGICLWTCMHTSTWLDTYL